MHAGCYCKIRNKHISTYYKYTLADPDSMIEHKDLEVLERKHAMYVLVAIKENPDSTKTDIMRLERGDEKTKFQRINELIALGYIDTVFSEGYSTKRLILTKKGDRLVKHIEALRGALA